MQTLRLEVEVDRADRTHDDAMELSPQPGLVVRVDSVEEGHGFGISDLVVVVVTVSEDVASELVASAIIVAVAGVIRRVRGRAGKSDGSPKELRDLVELERGSDNTEVAAEKKS